MTKMNQTFIDNNNDNDDHHRILTTAEFLFDKKSPISFSAKNKDSKNMRSNNSINQISSKFNDNNLQCHDNYYQCEEDQSKNMFDKNISSNIVKIYSLSEYNQNHIDDDNVDNDDDDENKFCSVTMNHFKSSKFNKNNINGGNSSTTSGCSTQSSTSSSISMPSAIQLFHMQSTIDYSHKDIVDIKNINDKSKVNDNNESIDNNNLQQSNRRYCSSSSSALISSPQSISVQPSSGSQWEKIGHFIEFYEKNLIQCLSCIQQQQQWKNHHSSTRLSIMDNDNKHKCIKNDELFQQSTNVICNKFSTDKKSFIDDDNDKHEIYNNNSNDSTLYDLIQIQLNNVVRIRQQYEHGKRCQEALVKMAKLSINNGSNRFRKNCYREWRTNERMLQSLASNLQSLIGTFEIIVENIEGWARICPRDYYELEFCYAQQRHVLRVKIVGRQLQRIWDFNRNSLSFQAALQTNITCRIRERKSGLWRSLAVLPSRYRYVDIGKTSITLTDFFQSIVKQYPLLIDCNYSGSIKLRVKCRWHPNRFEPDANFEMYKKDSISRKLLSSPLLRSTINTGRLNRQNSLFGNYEKPLRKYSEQFEQHQHQQQQQQQSRPSFGINKNLARSLLSLPTFISTPDIKEDCFQSNVNVQNKTNESEVDNVVDDVPTTSHPLSSPTSSLSSLSFSPSPSPWNDQLKSTISMLKTLDTLLQDHYGQSIEITLMSQAVTRLIDIYEQIKHKYKNNLNKKQQKTNEMIEEAFQFLDDNDTIINDKNKTKILASFDSNEYDQLSNNNDNDNELINQLNQLLINHIESAIQQLDLIGTWILKSKEKCAFLCLKADTFAMEQIYLILLSIIQSNSINNDKDRIYGKDEQVLEFFKHINENWTFMLTKDEFFRILLSMIRIHILIDDNDELIADSEEMDDLFRKSAQWLSSTMISFGNSCLFNDDKQQYNCCNDIDIITIFNIRAFFELHLFDYDRRLKNKIIEKNDCQLKLSELFRSAFDLNCLKNKIRVRKWSISNVEKILFETFNPKCKWLPSDLTLLLINILYEHDESLMIRKNNHHHLNNYYESYHCTLNSYRSISEIKKSDRLRELSRLINRWLIWQWQQKRFEIREHILIGLESSNASDRQASCYGIMHLFRLIQSSIQYNNANDNDESFIVMKLFFGKEMDCLLYISMQDPDIRVRDEAKNSIRSLSLIFGEQPQQMDNNELDCSIPVGNTNTNRIVNNANKTTTITTMNLNSEQIRSTTTTTRKMFRKDWWLYNDNNNDNQKNVKPTMMMKMMRTSMPNLYSQQNYYK